jgi:hypothetical protein
MTTKRNSTYFSPGEGPGFHTVVLEAPSGPPPRRQTILHQKLMDETISPIRQLLLLYKFGVETVHQDPEGCDPAHMACTVIGTLFVNVLHSGASAEDRLNMGNDIRSMLDVLQASIEEAITQDREGGGTA